MINKSLKTAILQQLLQKVVTTASRVAITAVDATYPEEVVIVSSCLFSTQGPEGSVSGRSQTMYAHTLSE